MKARIVDGCVLCFKWRFRNEDQPRYFYCDSLEDCKKRIEKTYKCNPDDYIVVSAEYRDSKTNRLVKEEVYYEQISML